MPGWVSNGENEQPPLFSGGGGLRGADLPISMVSSPTVTSFEERGSWGPAMGERQAAVRKRPRDEATVRVRSISSWSLRESTGVPRGLAHVISRL